MEKTVLRKSDMDFLRILSSVMVVLLHTAAMGAIIPGEKGFILNTVLNSITRFCVPVFIMISGYFMLEKEEDFSFFAKRSIKLILIMLGWSALYLIRYSLSGAVEINSFKEAIKYLLTEPVHLWYFYALFALTIFTPALGVFARNTDKKTYIYTMTLMLLFGSVLTMILKENKYPALYLITDKLKIGTAMTFPAYYLFGYYVKRFGINKKLSAAGFFAGAVLTIAGTVILSLRKGFLSENVLSFFAINVAVMSMGIFSFFEGKNIRGIGFIKAAAPLTAGIYGLHMLILPSVYEKLSVISFEPLKIFAVVTVTYVLCAMAVFIYKFLKDKLSKFITHKKAG